MKLAELGNEVMVVDKDEAMVSRLAPIVTSAKIADCQEEGVLKELGVSNFDICFVCVSGDFQSSLEITYMLKQLDAKHIVSKTDREKQGDFLLKIGADEVIHSEKEIAQRIAKKYSVRNAFDYIELSQDYVIIEIGVPKTWVGHSISEINVRSKFGVNILGYKHDSNSIIPMLNPSHVFSANEHLIIAGVAKEMMKLTSKL